MVEVVGSTKPARWNDFQRKTAGDYYGEGHRAKATEGFRENEVKIDIKQDIKGAVTNYEYIQHGSNALNEIIDR